MNLIEKKSDFCVNPLEANGIMCITWYTTLSSAAAKKIFKILYISYKIDLHSLGYALIKYEKYYRSQMNFNKDMRVKL